MTDPELNPVNLLLKSIGELKDEFRDFLKEYHGEVLEIWKEITAQGERLKNAIENQGRSARIQGLIGGALSALVTLIVAALAYFLKGGK